MSTFFGAIAQREPGAKEKNKRMFSQQMREAREEAASSSGYRLSFELELVRLYAQNRTAGWMAMVLLAAGMAITQFYFWLPLEQVIIGVAVVALSQALCVVMATRFLKDISEQEKNIPTWRNVFVLTEAVASLSWCLLLLGPLYLQNPETKIFTVFCTLLVSAVTTMLGASIPVAVMTAILPITLLVGVDLWMSPDLTSRAMAGMIAASSGFFILLVYRLYNSTVDTISHRAEKDALIGELEEAKVMSDSARMRAEEANKAKSSFLATMSHELRTPLNAIIGFSEMMKEEVFGKHVSEHYKEYSADIHRSGQHLLNLINEILDISRIEAGKHELQEGAVSLIHTVEDSLHLVKMKAEAKGIKIHTRFEPSLPKLWADERAIKQIAINILTNAVKFTPQSGEIFVKAGWTSSGGQYLSIRDTGPGVPEDEIAIVLSSFGRGSHAVKTAEQGTGLGLPIVKALAERHGGKMDFKSKLREGTDVVITFPASRVMDTLAPVQQANPRVA